MAGLPGDRVCVDVPGRVYLYQHLGGSANELNVWRKRVSKGKQVYRPRNGCKTCRVRD